MQEFQLKGVFPRTEPTETNGCRGILPLVDKSKSSIPIFETRKRHHLALASQNRTGQHFALETAVVSFLSLVGSNKLLRTIDCSLCFTSLVATVATNQKVFLLDSLIGLHCLHWNPTNLQQHLRLHQRQSFWKNHPPSNFFFQTLGME